MLSVCFTTDNQDFRELTNYLPPPPTPFFQVPLTNFSTPACGPAPQQDPKQYPKCGSTGGFNSESKPRQSFQAICSVFYKLEFLESVGVSLCNFLMEDRGGG